MIEEEEKPWHRWGGYHARVPGLRRAILNVRVLGSVIGCTGGRQDLRELVHYLLPDMTEPFHINFVGDPDFISLHRFDPPQVWGDHLSFEPIPDSSYSVLGHDRYWGSYYKWLDRSDYWELPLRMEEFLAEVPENRIVI